MNKKISQYLIEIINKFNSNLSKEQYYKLIQDQKNINTNIYKYIPNFMSNFNIIENEKYWKQIFSTWLHFFIPFFLHRKLLFDNLSKEQIKELSFYQKLRIDNISDLSSFMYGTNDISINYNLLNNIHYFYSRSRRIDNFKIYDNFEIQNKIFENQNNILIKNNLLKLLKKYLKGFIISIIYKIYLLIIPKNYILFTYPDRFDFRSKIKILLKTKFRVLFELKTRKNKVKPSIFNIKLREKLFNYLYNQNKFDKTFLYIFCLSIPVSLLENFSKYYYHKSNQFFFKKKPKIVFSSGSHVSYEINMCMLAKLYSKQTNINIIQHGNLYNIIDKEYHSGIDLEFEYSKLITWGWSNDSFEIPMSSPRLFTFISKVNQIRDNNIKRILFVSQPVKKYDAIRSFHYLPRLNYKANNNRIKLYNNLPKNLKDKFFFRNYPYENYKGCLNNFEVSQELLNVKFDTYSKYESIKNSSIIIIDSLSTMILEILNLNKPFFLLFDYDDYFINKRHHNFFKLLIKTKILHANYTTLISLIEKVNLNNFNEFYYSKERRIALRYLRMFFARISYSHDDKWSKYLNKLLDTK
tara:strand:- start:958 stop:2697 length:1740 start_codon:yes stop_codon:yes gene_type:complete